MSDLQMTLRLVREDLDLLWGMLTIDQIRMLQEAEPDTLPRLGKNHQIVGHGAPEEES